MQEKRGLAAAAGLTLSCFLSTYKVAHWKKHKKVQWSDVLHHGVGQGQKSDEHVLNFCPEYS